MPLPNLLGQPQGLPLQFIFSREKKMNNLILRNGLLAYKENNFDGAIKYFNKLEDEKKFYFLGLTHVRMKEYDTAIHYLKIYLRKETDYQLMIQIYLILGYIYAQKNEFVRSHKYLEKVLQLDFNNSKAYSALGYVDYRLKNYNMSIKNFKKAIEIDKKNATAHNSLGYVYADTNMNLDEAIRECETALQIAPEYAAYLDSLGWAYYKKNDYSNAKKYLSMALEKDPENQEIKKHFKDVIVKEISKKQEKID